MWQPEKKGGGFYLPAPSVTIFFENVRFCGSKRTFSQKEKPA